jgi:hypothetical protein
MGNSGKVLASPAAAAAGMCSVALGEGGPLTTESNCMRCYFHLVNSHDEILDQEGIEVSDLEKAKAEALAVIDEIRQEHGDDFEDWKEWRLDIVSSDGTLLHSTGSNSPLRLWLSQAECPSTSISSNNGNIVRDKSA